MINFVSVLIPVYNAEQFLERVLDSVLNQSFKNFELLLINDGSSDRSAEIMNAYALKDARIIVIHQANAGKSKALNRLVEMCSSDWCVFMDNDDLMLPNRLAEQINFHNQNPEVTASSSHCHYIDEHDQYCGTQTYNGLKTKEDSFEARRNKKIVNGAFTALMARKEIYQKIGGLRSEFWPVDDFDFINRWIESGNSLVIIQAYLMKYRIHNKSITMMAGFDFKKVDYCNYCQNLRVNGLNEISFEEYLAILKKMPLLHKLNKRFHSYAAYFHKSAGISYYKKEMPAFLVKICLATLFDFRYVYTSFKNQRNKVALEGNSNI